DLYVLVTTANNPDIMMPAFDDSAYYVIFFVAFLVICFFIYMNIILAVIYNNYRKHLKNEVRKTVFSKRQQLSKAFEILAIKSEGQKVITRSRFVQLMKLLDSKKNPAFINVMWIVLDCDGSDCLEKREFLKLADLLNVEVSEVVDRTTFIGHYLPSIYYSKPSRVLCRIVKHKFDFVVIGAAFIMALVDVIIQNEQESRLSLDVLLVLRVLRLVKIIGSIGRFKVIVLTITKVIPSLITYGGVIMVFYYMFAIVGMESFQGLVKFTGYDVEGESDLFCSNSKLELSDFWRDHYCNNNFNDVIHAFIVMFELTVVNQWHVIAYGYAAVTDPWARLYFLLFHLICVIIVLNIFTAFVLEVFILEYSATCEGNLESQLEKKIQEMGLSFKRKVSNRVSSVSKEDLVSSDSDSSDADVLDSPPNNPTSDNDGGITQGDSIFYPGYKDVSGETDVRFHISKRLKSVEVLLQKMFEKEIEVDDLGPNIENLDKDLQDEDTYLSGQNRTLWGM
ncbi:hypothetical protein OTU49_004433, partial [Cherax quadricarinatus]